MSGSRSYWELVEPYWERANIYGDPDEFLSGFSTLPEVAQHLFAAHWTQSEVRNGGFTQFFWNPTGILAPEAALAFDAIHMPQSAAVVREAMGWLGEPYPRDREVRDRLIEAFDPRFFDAVASEPNPTVEEANDKFFALLYSEEGGFYVAADLFAAKYWQHQQ